MPFTINQKKKSFKSNALAPVSVTIGDDKDARRNYHQVKLERWGECNLSIRIDLDGEDAVAEIKDKALHLKSSKVESRCFNLDPEEIGEDGGFEWTITLPQKPESNRIPITLNAPKNLKFYFQPPLTKEEIDKGVELPDKYVNSWAVYHASKSGDYSALWGQNYRSGKAFHVYRLWAMDAKGSTSWVDLELQVDKDHNLVSRQGWIVLPEEFFKLAISPIDIDPTFGFESIGARNGATESTYMESATLLSPSDFGNASSISLYIKGTSSAGLVGIGLYDSDFNKLAEDSGNANITTTAGWVTVNIPYAGKRSTTYRTVVLASVSRNLYYDYGSSGDSHWLGSQTWETWPAAMSSPTVSDCKYSLYCTYAAAGSQATASASPTTNTAISGTWNSPTSVYIDDTSYCNIATGTTQNVTRERDFGGFNFAALPADTFLVSVTLEAAWYVSTTASIITMQAQAYNGTTALGSALSDTAEPTSITTRTLDLTESVTVADLKSANFKVRLRAIRGDSTTAATCYYDCVKVTVVYESTSANLVTTFPVWSFETLGHSVQEYKGNLYLPLIWGEGTSVRMLKSTDMGASFAGEDTANDITDFATSDIHCVTTKLDNILYVAWWSSGDYLSFRPFDMATDTWGATHTSTIQRAAGQWVLYSLTLAARKNGDLVFGVCMPVENVDGTDYQRCGWCKWTAAAQSFSAVTSLASGLAYMVVDPMAVVDDLDRVHFRVNVGWTTGFITLNSDDTLDSGDTIAGSDAMNAAPILYRSAGKQYVLLPYTSNNTYKYVVAETGDSLVFGSEVDTGAASDDYAAFAEINGSLYVFYRDIAKAYLKARSNVGGSWGNEEAFRTPNRTFEISATSIPALGRIAVLHYFETADEGYSEVAFKTGFPMVRSGNAGNVTGNGAPTTTGHKGSIGTLAVSGGGVLEAAGQVRTEEHDGGAALSSGGSIETYGVKGVRSLPITITGSGFLAGGGKKSFSAGTAVSGSGSNQAGGNKTAQGRSTVSAGGEGAASGFLTKKGAFEVSSGGNPVAAGGPDKRGTTMVSRGGAARMSGRTGRIGMVSSSGGGGQQAVGRVSREYIPLICFSSVIERARATGIQLRSLDIDSRARTVNQGYQQRAVKVLEQSRIVSLGVEE